MSPRLKSFFEYTRWSLMWLAVGLAPAGFFGWKLKHPPVSSAKQEFHLYMPASREIRSWDEVRTVTQVRGGEAGPFRIFVSCDEFDRLARESKNKPLVARMEYSISENLTQEYWLSRGDGAWYTTSVSVAAPWWNFWWNTEWVRQNDEQVVARQVFDRDGSDFFVLVGCVMTFVSFLRFLYRIWEWKSDYRWRPRYT